MRGVPEADAARPPCEGGGGKTSGRRFSRRPFGCWSTSMPTGARRAGSWRLWWTSWHAEHVGRLLVAKVDTDRAPRGLRQVQDPKHPYARAVRGWAGDGPERRLRAGAVACARGPAPPERSCRAQLGPQSRPRTLATKPFSRRSALVGSPARGSSANCSREPAFAVTQATVSRDIRELRLAKVPGAEGIAAYTLPGGVGKHSPAPEPAADVVRLGRGHRQSSRAANHDRGGTGGRARDRLGGSGPRYSARSRETTPF